MFPRLSGMLDRPLPPPGRPAQVRSNLLATQSFKDTFGPNTKRKRPKLSVDNLAELSVQADERDERWVGGKGASGGCLRFWLGP